LPITRLPKHSTASVYILAKHLANGGGARLALVRHPRFGKWMVPGGHVEAHENPAQTAIREVHEETGLAIRLLPPATPPLPGNVTDRAVPLPHWIVEEHVPADRDPRPHIHVDHLYVALAIEAGQPDEHLDLGWYGPDAVAGLDMFADSRALALALFKDVIHGQHRQTWLEALAEDTANAVASTAGLGHHQGGERPRA